MNLNFGELEAFLSSGAKAVGNAVNAFKDASGATVQIGSGDSGITPAQQPRSSTDSGGLMGLGVVGTLLVLFVVAKATKMI